MEKPKRIGSKPFPENDAVQTNDGMNTIYGPSKNNPPGRDKFMQSLTELIPKPTAKDGKPNFVDLVSIHFNGGSGDTETLYAVVKFMEHVWNTHVLPLQEELKSTVDEKWEVISDADKTIKQLQAENKLLRGQLEACEQHNKILCEQKVGYLQEIERLKADHA